MLNCNYTKGEGKMIFNNTKIEFVDSYMDATGRMMIVINIYNKFKIARMCLDNAKLDLLAVVHSFEDTEIMAETKIGKFRVYGQEKN